uniref:Transmembrane and coiled-coil domain-containing protein 4-like n=1 Tax=Saccoglossus kowalevskii TaxID=10224 RepID=A0ABM0GJC9_SACKO
MSSIDMDNGAVDETSHNTEICDGVVITATKITCMKMNLREDGNDFDAANSQDTSDEKDDADQERILCDGDRVDIDIDNKNETLNGIMMNCSITEMKDLPVGKDECSSMRNGQKDEENDKNLSDNDEEQEKENNNQQRLLTDAAAQLGAMKDITMETDSYECHQEKKEEVCNDENKCDVINSPIFGEEITNELPNKDDDVIPDGCVTPDSESIIDFDENIAIVTEEKTKKPTLAAVVKDETGKGKLVYQVLGDASRFSYACVCAVSLGHLFETEYDSNYAITIMLFGLVNDINIQEWSLIIIWDVMSRNLKDFSYVDLQSSNAFKPCVANTFCMTCYVDLLRRGKTKIAMLQRKLIPCNDYDLVTLALGSGEYDARMRVLIFHVAWHLTVKWRHLERFEEVLVKMLKEQEEETEEQKKERATNQKKKKRKRYALIGLATVGGGALIGLTAGLAAPLIAAGVGAVIGTSAAAALTTTAGIAIMTSLFGAAGAGLTGYKMKRRVGAIEQFEFAPLSQGNNLHVAIAISGWLSDEQPDNFHAPWINLAISNEQYYLRWESKYLLDLGRALEYLLNGLVTAATQEALKYTVLSGLLAALMWPATLLSVASVIDNPWGVAMQRSTEVGHQLADVIMSKQQGHRPVTLIGFSLGAKVIYNCLEEMLKRK